MSYCDILDIQARMIGTTFDTATTNLVTINMEVAESEINKYLSKRYDVSSWDTFTSAPPMVQTLCQWLTIGYSYEDNARGGKDAFTRAERYISRAMKNLIDLRDYKAELVDIDGEVVPDKSNTAYRVLSNTADYSNTMNEDNYLNWKVDRTKLSDIKNERS